jgi:hypothetical protein
MMTATQDAPPTSQQPLTRSQRIIAAARRARELAVTARERQRAGVRAPADAKGKAAAQAAAELRVSPRSVEQAVRVLKGGIPALVEAVERGAVSTRAAARLVGLVPDKQAEAVRRLVAGEPLPTVLAALEATPDAIRRFDDERVLRLVAEVMRLIHLRIAVFSGASDGNANRALSMCQELRDALRRWRRDGPPNEERKDVTGRLIPPKALPGYMTLAEIEGTCRDISALIRRVERLAGQPGGRAIPVQPVAELLRRVSGALWDSRSTVLCPACRGYLPSPTPSCPICGGSGWALPSGVLPTR